MSRHHSDYSARVEKLPQARAALSRQFGSPQEEWPRERNEIASLEIFHVERGRARDSGEFVSRKRPTILPRRADLNERSVSRCCTCRVTGAADVGTLHSDLRASCRGRNG